MSLFGFFKRPSFWTVIIALAAYWDPAAIAGKFVYDDAGSVVKNVVVNGQVPWTDAFIRDYWGTLMAEPQSHKSFRPITTLTFKLNWLLAEKLEESDPPDKPKNDHDKTYFFHVFNVILHAINSGLVTEAAAFVFDDAGALGGSREGDILAQLITGIIFGIHPVHAEAVSNITSRGELLMTFFFLLAFLSYASHIPTKKSPKRGCCGTLSYILCIYFFPWICMSLSLFSKEQGATTLCTLVAYDFLKHHGSVKQYWNKLKRGDRFSVYFLGRTIVLAIQTLALVALRYWLNGESSPDFIFDQNPAGFSEDRLTRVFSISWVYCLYIRDAVWPLYLAPDWSGRSIDLIEDISEPRALLVILLWIFAFACVQSLFLGLSDNATRKELEVRRVLLMAFVGFMFLPFLLSSNLLVVVGLMKADRVIYLPLFGFCIMEALLFKTICCSSSASSPTDETEKKNDESTSTRNTTKQTSSPQAPLKLRVHWLGHLIMLAQIAGFVLKNHERNIAWSSPEILWTKAFNINPRSHHTMYNCGYELSLRQRYEEAEQVMRPIGSPRVDGPSNTFVYAMVLYNLGKCDEAHEFIDEAMDVIEKQREEGGLRHTPASLDRTKSNLLVARGYCTMDDFQQQGRVFQEAVRTDPRNTYAVQQFQAYLKKMEQIKEMKEKYGLTNVEI